jgi:hypothetical protein
LFDEGGMIVADVRYDQEGKMTARLTYVNDTTKRRILARVMEQWTTIGYLKQVAEYSYDSVGFLTRVTDRNASGQVFGTSLIRCDGKGYPVELDLLDEGGNPIGKETAVYLFDQNRAVTSILGRSGQVLSSDTIKISFDSAYRYPTPGEMYNDHGDAIQYSSKNLNGTVSLYESEFRYDIAGNIVQETIYHVTVRGNGKRKRRIDRLFKREYTY